MYAQSISPGNNTEDTKSNDDACLAMKDGSWQSSGRVEMPQSHGEGIVNVNGVGQTYTASICTVCVFLNVVLTYVRSTCETYADVILQYVYIR